MGGRGQSKTRKNGENRNGRAGGSGNGRVGGSTSGRALNLDALQPLRDVFGDDFCIDEIGSNTHSPAHEEFANDNQEQLPNNSVGNKQKHASKFASRIQIVLKANGAVDPTPKQGNEVDENPPKKIRTKYMHQSRQEREGIEHNNLYSSQASTTSAKKKGERGNYRMLSLEKKTRGGECKLEVEIPDFVLQAVGENARPMVNFCGYVVRTTAFMDAGDWADVFAKHGDSMWLQVKNKFYIKDSSTHLLRLQAFATNAMQRLYRFWNARLHAYFKECGDSYEECLENPPDDFPIDNWRACCAVFNSKKFKKRSLQNSQNRKSEKWNKHTTGNLSYPEVEHILTKNNGGVLPEPDVIWLAEHTTMDGGILKWVNDGRSKEIHAQLHQLVEDKDKEPEGDQPRPQTQEEMLLHVLGPKPEYTRGKGNGHRSSAKAKLQEEQQQIVRKQQDQIIHLQSELEANKKAMDEYKEEQKQIMAAMEKRFMEMITKNTRMGDDDAVGRGDDH